MHTLNLILDGFGIGVTALCIAWIAHESLELFALVSRPQRSRRK